MKEVADRCLEFWDDACNSLNITHFLALGTCLGFYRDGGYIKGDHDIDVGVLCSGSDLSKLAEKLVEKGFVSKKIQRTRDFMYFTILSRFHPSEEKFLKSFGTVTYKGRTYKIPHPIDEYLKLHYDHLGDWREPRRGMSRLAPTSCYEPILLLYWLEEQ